MKFKKTNSKKNGFTLIELILVLGIVAIAFVTVLGYIKRMAEQTRAEAAAEQFVEIGKALGNYISRESGNLLSCVSAGSSITVTGLTFLQSSTGTTTAGTCTLNNRQLLPTTLNTNNLFGVGYTISIQNTASGSLGGLVISSGPIKDPSMTTTVVRYDWIGFAMKKAGAQSGMTFIGSPNTMTGLGAGWALTSADYASINQVGLFGYRVGYQGTYDDVYLRLDGAYPMKGNLNMGNYNVNNATDINYNGWLNGNNALLNNLKTGYISNSGNIQTNTLTASNSISTFTTDSSGNAVTQGSLDNAGLLTVNNIRLKTTTCSGAGATNGLTASQIASVTGKDCLTTAYNGMITDRLPQYVSKGAQIVTDGQVISKPSCSATNTDATLAKANARIIVTPQIQNVYGNYEVQLVFEPLANNSYNVGINRSQFVASQIQVYATDNGTSWTVHISDVSAAVSGTGTTITPGYQGVAQLFCDFG